VLLHALQQGDFPEIRHRPNFSYSSIDLIHEGRPFSAITIHPSHGLENHPAGNSLGPIIERASDCSKQIDWHLHITMIPIPIVLGDNLPCKINNLIM
jgi:hypothetical protein